MLQTLTIILAHHELRDRPFWLLLVAATLVSAVVLVTRKTRG
jgi:hypothetical protein